MLVIRVYSRMVFRLGMVIFQNIWEEVAPSNSAASYKSGLMPSTPDTSTIMVLPYHIQNWIKAMIPRVGQTFVVKLIAVSVRPSFMSRLFTGPIG